MLRKAGVAIQEPAATNVRTVREDSCGGAFISKVWPIDKVWLLRR